MEWYPKGSGGRSAVQKLLKVLLGAENKLSSMKEKLEGLYSDGGIDVIQHGMESPSGQTAAATIFAAKIMSIVGRRIGFVSASITGSIACLIGAYSIMIESFAIFCISKFILGATMAFTHQYRFAAAESVEKEKAPKAISSLLLAGIVAAFLGISLSNYTKNFVSDYLYVGSYCLLYTSDAADE